MTSHQAPTLDDGMFQAVYEELRRLARGFARSHGNRTLNATALVHEAYIKLSLASRFHAESPQHLKRTLVMAMKQILIDAARRRAAEIRGGPEAAHRSLPLDHVQAQAASIDPHQLLLIELALREMETRHELATRAFELQFFGGLEIREIAELLEVSDKKVQRLLRLAKAHLSLTLSKSSASNVAS